VKPLSTVPEGTTKINYERTKVIYMGNVEQPKKVNDACVRTMHAGTMDKGFTVNSYCIGCIFSWYK
jgi:hypothetical protein